MAKTTKKKTKQKWGKKEARMEAFQKLSAAFNDCKKGESEKKWTKRLKRASKLLAPMVSAPKASKPVEAPHE